MVVNRVGQDARSRAPNSELIVIYKGKPAWDVRAHCVINHNIFVHKYFLCFVRNPPFDVNPPHSFINEAPGLHHHPTSTQLRWFGVSWTAKWRKSSQHLLSMWELLQDSWKSIPDEAGWENAKSVQSCHLGKGWLLWRISNITFFICLTLFWLLHDSMCYFLVLMSSLLFYSVEKSKNKEKPLN